MHRELPDPTWRRRREWDHSQYTSVQHSLFTSAERTSRAWLKGQHGSSNHGLHFIFVRLQRICPLVLHMSHPLLFSHLPFTTSTSSSSSFTLPSTTTQEHEEHPVHHAHLQALPVDKLRHQESLWRAVWRKPAHHNSHRYEQTLNGNEDFSATPAMMRLKMMLVEAALKGHLLAVERDMA